MVGRHCCLCPLRTSKSLPRSALRATCVDTCDNDQHYWCGPCKGQYYRNKKKTHCDHTHSDGAPLENQFNQFLPTFTDEELALLASQSIAEIDVALDCLQDAIKFKDIDLSKIFAEYEDSLNPVVEIDDAMDTQPDFSNIQLLKKRGRHTLDPKNLAPTTKRKRFFEAFRMIINSLEDLNARSDQDEMGFRISAIFTIRNIVSGTDNIRFVGESEQNQLHYLQLIVKKLALLSKVSNIILAK